MDEELGQVIGAALGKEPLECREVALPRPFGDAAADRRVAFAGLGPLGELMERTSYPSPRRRMVVTEMRRMAALSRRQVKPRSPPLRMQRLHGGIAAPQRHAVGHQPLAEAGKQVGGIGAAQPLAHHPAVQVDDAPAEQPVEATRQESR